MFKVSPMMTLVWPPIPTVKTQHAHSEKKSWGLGMRLRGVPGSSVMCGPFDVENL